MVQNVVRGFPQVGNLGALKAWHFIEVLSFDSCTLFFLASGMNAWLPDDSPLLD